MQGMGEGDCPFEFNFDPATFKVGDTVSYRVVGSATLADWPFVGTLLEVHDDHVIIAGDPMDPTIRYRGTRDARPEVQHSEI